MTEVGACPQGTFSDTDNSDRCSAFRDCAEDEYETAAPSAVRQRECTPHTRCGPGELVESEGSGTQDRVCTPCPEGRFTDGENRTDCSAWTRCQPGRVESKAPTASRDRVCDACLASEYEAMGQCLPLSDCARGQYVSTSATATSDRACSPCPARTFSADKCTRVTRCDPVPAGEVEPVSPRSGTRVQRPAPLRRTRVEACGGAHPVLAGFLVRRQGQSGVTGMQA